MAEDVTSRPKEKAMIKVIVLGCANVGKTSIMERYCCAEDYCAGLIIIV
jgi:GTPase SAR1 family protein